jgi:hypothetical protein
VRAQDSYLPSFQTRARHPTSCRQAELGGPHERREYPRHHYDDRAPLLLIAGGEDHLFPPSVNESNVKHYRNSKAITEFEEFPGRALHVRAGRLGGGRRLRPRVSHGERNPSGALSVAHGLFTRLPRSLGFSEVRLV